MLHATGTQDLNKMGGLLKYMPLTAATALVASLSISGVPLFNGFASKWTIYVAAVQGSRSAGYLAVFAAIAILTSALTLASFIKFFGASFLSRTSALVQEKAAGQAPAGSRLDDADSAGVAGADLRAAGDRAGHRLWPDASGRWPPARMVLARRSAEPCRCARQPLGRHLRRRVAVRLRSAGAGWPSWGWRFLRPGLFRSSAARRAGPRFPGFAVTRAKRNATVMWRTAFTARSNVISAGSAARPRRGSRNPRN